MGFWGIPMEKFDVCNDKLPNTPTKSNSFYKFHRFFSRWPRIRARGGASFLCAIVYFREDLPMENNSSAAVIVENELQEITASIKKPYRPAFLCNPRASQELEAREPFDLWYERFLPQRFESKTCAICGGPIEITDKAGKCAVCGELNIFEIYRLTHGVSGKPLSRADSIAAFAARHGFCFQRYPMTLEQNNYTRQLLESMVTYLNFGWSLFLCWWIIPEETETGVQYVCACSKWKRKNTGTKCSKGKHPLGSLYPEGFLNATKSREELLQHVSKFPQANLAVATGSVSGFWVLDVDLSKGEAIGQESLDKLIQQYGELPDTVEGITGSGGRHLLFKAPKDRVIKCSGSQVAPKIDVRGDGGYIVVSPSTHESGSAYRWKEGHAPGEIELAEAPDWLVELCVRAGEKQERESQKEPKREKQKNTHSSRHDTDPRLEQLKNIEPYRVISACGKEAYGKKTSVRDEKDPSVQINDDWSPPAFYDHGTQETFDNIGFVERTRGCSFIEACNFLCDLEGLPRFQFGSKDYERKQEGSFYNEGGIKREPNKVHIFPDYETACLFTGVCSTALIGGYDAASGNERLPGSMGDDSREVFIFTDAANDIQVKGSQKLASGICRCNKELRIVDLSPVLEGLSLKSYFERHDLDHLKKLLISVSQKTERFEPPILQTKTGYMVQISNYLDLGQKVFPKINWIVPRIIMESNLILFAAPPKGGKSLLCTNVSLAVASGGLALGELQCIQGKTLYLALEDSERRLQARLITMNEGKPLPADALYTRDWPAFPEGIEMLQRWLDKNQDCRLVIIDTIQKLKPLSDKSRNEYANDYALLGPLHRLALDRNLAIIAVHHTRKQQAGNDSDPFERPLGSQAQMGVCDSTIILERSFGTNEGTLFIKGRDVEESTFTLEFDAATLNWRFVGVASDVKRSKESTEILEILRKAKGVPLSAKDFAEKLDVSRRTIQKRLERLVDKEEIVKAAGQDGKYLISPDERFKCPF
jgi:biotin operon repressor